MESYEEFIQKQQRKLCRSDSSVCDSLFNSYTSSLISFYGSPILPPLLNGEQRKEMQRLRESALKKSVRWRESCNSRMSYAQKILDSVQFRKAPTLLEFQNEPQFTDVLNTDFPSTSNSAESPADEYADISGNFWNPQSMSLCPSEIIFCEKVRDPCHPLTSTACDDLSASPLKSLEEEETFDNSQVTVLCEGLSVLGYQKQRALELNTSGELDSESFSDSKKHPHADVSHQALSSGYVTNETTDVASQPSWVDSINGGTESKFLAEGDLDVVSTAQPTSKSQNIISHAPVDGDALQEECEVRALSQGDEITERADVSPEPDTAEGPYRMSLQTLLKKSQEHRRRQRMLRNQAKNLRACKTGQAEEHSLSDKENEEFHSAALGKTELRKAREKRKDQGKVQFSDPVQTHTDERETERAESNKMMSDVVETSVTQTEVLVEQCADNSSDVELMSDSFTGKAAFDVDNLPRSTSPTAPTTAKSLYLTKGKRTVSRLPRPCLLDGKKFKNVPTPQFCLSPVRSKKGGGRFDTLRKPLGKTLCEDKDPDPGKRGNKGADMSSVTEVIAPLDRSMEKTHQIAQLELNLSSLKALISDLESTLIESQADQMEAPSPGSTSLQKQQLSPAGHCSTGIFNLGGNLSSLASVSGPNGTVKPVSFGQYAPSRCVTSLVQKKRVPSAFRNIAEAKRQQQRGSVLTDNSNQSNERRKNEEEKNKKKALDDVKESLSASCLNRSYDVDTPSRLWSCDVSQGKQLTPETLGQDGASRAKRRLLMHAMEESCPSGGDGIGWEQLEYRSSPKAVQSSAQERQLLQLRLEDESQKRTLEEEEQEKERRRQQELLQIGEQSSHVVGIDTENENSLAMRYQFLRSMSFPCPGSRSRLEDTPTSLQLVLPSPVGLDSSTPELTAPTFPLVTLTSSQSPVSLTVSCGPLVVAAVKGYLTRRLLRTERVTQLIRTIKDTQLFLLGFQAQTPVRGEYSSRQDLMLQERVALQLRSARYELYDLFFSVSSSERMQIIAWDRELARERQLKRQEHKAPRSSAKGSLSAATKKALERKRSIMLQKKVPERAKSAQGGECGWTVMPNPRRVPKRTTPSRRPR